MEEIRLSIYGMDGDEQTIETAYMAERDGHTHVVYEETLEAFKGHKSRLKFKDNYLELTRNGKLPLRMIFEPGREHRMQYPTAFGTLDIGILTEAVTIKKGKNMTTLEALYTMDVEDRPRSIRIELIKKTVV